jgi:hypothetical protein
MKVLIDTNVLVSAALNPDGVPAEAYRKAASYLSILKTKAGRRRTSCFFVAGFFENVWNK